MHDDIKKMEKSLEEFFDDQDKRDKQLRGIPPPVKIVNEIAQNIEQVINNYQTQPPVKLTELMCAT